MFSIKNIGLRNVEVADTKLCLIDGENGRLLYRGYDIFDLAKNSTFEETSYLLLYGDLPTKEQLEEFDEHLRGARALPKEVTDAMLHRSRDARPMDVLISSVAMLADYDPIDESKPANLERSTSLIAKLPTIVATWNAIRSNRPIPEPNPDLSHAANTLYMLLGSVPDRETARMFDICLILHAEHSFNASTFAARQVASTRAHMYACICAAIAALSGDLHGGANVAVMRNLLEIGDESRVEEWVKARLDAGDKIMGLGHAVYKTDDPRAKVLREMSRRLAAKTGSRWYSITSRMEQVAKEEVRRRRGVEIYANVDLYSASVYYAMGIPMDLYTCIFAMARISGWCAHVIEEKFAEAQPKPVLYRPAATYVGRYCGPLGCEYVPVQKRGSDTAKQE
ncbi:MAG: citrate/2-methylcitrate synthase [Candidatus Nitrosocaldus sp.]|nr:citrate/2-methylcitrate synthase [Candidatus Nitrosocaldus sp.]